MKNVVIVDYGRCNLDSVARAVERTGGFPKISGKVADLEEADAIILPGVGAFADAMAELQRRSLVAPIRKMVLDENVPFLGICLGMQLMGTKGYEVEEAEGLGLVAGTVVRLVQDVPQTRIPHVGWNEVSLTRESPLFQGIQDRTDFYFVHSYHFRCDANYVLGVTPYCGGFVSAIGHNLCFGVQFHPEKSLRPGLAIFSNFLRLC